jgi:hypothetical protein
MCVRTFVIALMAIGGAVAFGWSDGDEADSAADELVILGYNDLGMHCMNDDFSELVILPPYNTLRAQILKRGTSPEPLVEDDMTVRYRIPGNTHSADKTNFWTYAEAAFGSPLPPNIGLTGNGMAGTMTRVPLEKHYEVTGIPITPIDDTGRFNPYPMASISVTRPNGQSAETLTVVPVSGEMSCNLCHQAEGVSTATDILRDHDVLHGTDLENSKPVLCASCHADAALGAPGLPDVPNLSQAVHGAHAPRMDVVNLDNACYACHPGIRTQCQRDVHLANGVDCVECHGGMEAVADPARQPWLDEPRCGDCHARPGFEFEQPGRLFKDSVGHGGVLCGACHGSPHAITPTLTATDNQQALMLQGYAGVIDDCLVCHTEMPSDPFFHAVDNE